MYFGQAIHKSNPFYMIIFILTEIGYGELQTIFFLKKNKSSIFHFNFSLPLQKWSVFHSDNEEANRIQNGNRYTNVTI